MTLRAFKERDSDNYDVSKLQDSIREYTSNLINGIEILKGNLIKDISLTQTVDNKISHKLGRALSGYFIAKLNKNANVWSTGSDSKTLTLNTGANGVVVTIWAF